MAAATIGAGMAGLASTLVAELDITVATAMPPGPPTTMTLIYMIGASATGNGAITTTIEAIAVTIMTDGGKSGIIDTNCSHGSIGQRIKDNMTMKIAQMLSMSAFAAALASPSVAQTQSHGAGVNWSGGHGGVSWDGGHGYGGYPVSNSPPTYRSPAAQQPANMPQRRGQVVRPDYAGPTPALPRASGDSSARPGRGGR
ncbi:hypothetical protein [Sphingobium sp. Z007]|uniref:hypothetical protein n=2 Tax=Sphingobium sp. Z007 TaxID=627495 RepID=UPI000B49DC75|nr:hypothetical protein [Sphingobium sp. Z007]